MTAGYFAVKLIICNNCQWKCLGRLTVLIVCEQVLGIHIQQMNPLSEIPMSDKKGHETNLLVQFP